ncbi:alpha/beta fold hydrolase [Nocardiopsis composta]|uniref:Pimeloyl-ACP methyl ester carboxylesterase n=1 Tax=Nocardiopsis composta TaxID=157465 RepID=A0A7W8VG22_9ACTN|nr:alpha/beta fold hydrolase [Nocardiopsis composta]MBB5434710.1 pimeloyl-ACP methyl ester carboxylesterase [Nocardiopsis composta]
MTAQEHMLAVNGIEIHAEEFGDPEHPPVLLIMGSMTQGAMWPDALVGRIAAAGYRVIRYDHRDTGRSSALDFEAAPYTWEAIRDDALGVLDALGVESAHLVGHSAGGVLAQWIAVVRPERVRSLTVIGSSPLGRREGRVILRALTGEAQPEGSLPEPAPEFVELFRKASAAPPSGREELIAFQVETARMLNGPNLPFDADAQRRLEERLLDRDRDPATVANHRLAAAADLDFEPVGALPGITAPTLVLEGACEPVKPGHGPLIAAEIPGARMRFVQDMGHTIAPEVVGEVTDTVLEHLAAAEGGAAG